MIQMFPQILRTGRQVSGAIQIPATAFRKWRIMSDLSVADMADSDLFVFMGIDIQDASGNWKVNAGGFVNFQCGPTEDRNGTAHPAGTNRGFDVDASVLAGKTVRGVLELRSGTGAFRSATIGITRDEIN